MFRSRMFPAAMAAVIALGASGAAFAATGGRIAAVLEAKTSIAQAIAAAEQHSGGQAMKIDVEKEKGAYLYEVKTVSKDKVAKVFVDPASGQVVRTDDEGLIARIFDREDRKEFGKLTALPTTLAAAIATAEQHTGGKAVKAGVEEEDGAIQFEVKVAKDKALHRVMIDGANGKVLKDVTVEHGDHDRDEHRDHDRD